ncbi:uncharacterized protein LOC130426541 [Triplophysa dalaica]|uniref:uncharacterized protein LOC130426541 n=1 Tax=Triplophysa dalaica TaxID=1582913 RepID=UPI0024E02C32|nr:uncharacterized protein LOC130426541 [Triplophysa dalaica]
MIQNKSRRFRPVGSIDEQLHSGVASLCPQTPPQRSYVPDRRGGGNIHQSLQTDHFPCFLKHIGQNPSPSRTPPCGSSTTPDDMWHRAFAKSVQRHAGVVLPPLVPPQKPGTAPKETWRRHHFHFQDGRYVKTPQGVPNYIADKRKRTWRNYTDLQLTLENERNEKVAEDRRRREKIEKEKRLEMHLNLRASIESLRLSILEAEAESRSVGKSIRLKDKDLRTLIGKSDELKIEIEKLEEKSKQISRKAAHVMKDVPHELWDTVLKNIVVDLTVYKRFQRQMKAEPHFCEYTTPEHCPEMFLTKSEKAEVESLAEMQKKICHEITGRLESLDRVKLDISFVSRQITNENELLKSISLRLERQRKSRADLQKSNTELLELIRSSR